MAFVLFKYIGMFFSWVFRMLGIYGKWIPSGFAGIFIVSDFIINWVRANLPYAFQNLAKTLFSAELIINEKVHLAIANAQSYNLLDFIHILISIYVIFSLVKFFAKLEIKIAGAQAEWGAYFMAIVIVAIIEISMIKIIDGTFGFIPLWNGIIFLIINIKPVLTAIITSPEINTMIFPFIFYYKRYINKFIY